MDINEAWKTTYKLFFNECNVELDDMKEYLLRYHYKPSFRKSSLSGREVVMCSPAYCDGAKFVSQDEVDFNRKFEPLNINEIKDLDSVVGALGDRMEYAGNKSFGESEFIENSDNCVDSFHVKDSHNVSASKYVAYSSFVRDNSEYAFGSAWFLGCKYTIKAICADSLTRCFETYASTNSSDLFFAFYCTGCTHAMFSFNLKSKRYCIGNLELPKERYFEIRKKLVDESREYMEKNKAFPSIFRLPLTKRDFRKAVTLPAMKPKKEDFKAIDDSFRSTCKIVLGKDIGPLKKYAEFLSSRVDRIFHAKSAFGNDIWYSDFYYYGEIPKERMADSAEVPSLGALHIELKDGEKPSLKEMLAKLDGIALYAANMDLGENSNAIETAIIYFSSNAYRVCDTSLSKNTAFCTMAQNGESQFGCFRAIYSKFCIKCHTSYNLTRCFEMDSCTDCSDSLFCHNCEGLDNCMFCFNTKSKRYAIGNVEVGRENFMKIKKIVMDEIVKKLEADGKLGFDIYDMGCR